MTKLTPQETMNPNTLFRKGDIFVLFGELFGRGYAAGLLDEAKAAGMTILGVTVGRREENNALRGLADDELAAAEGVVCGRGRNPTLRLWPPIFAGEVDMLPSQRRDMGQQIGQ